MIKRIFYLLVLTTGIVLAQSSPKIIVQPTEYDFGDIKQGTIAKKTFTIMNDGTDVLQITQVRASCGCTAVKPGKTELQPGESTELNVEFNSEGRIGKQNKIVYINSNDPENTTFKISFTGNVVNEENSAKGPQLTFEETSHDFGKVKEGKILNYTFKFVNKGKSTLEIKDVRTSCGCTAALVSSKKIEPGNEGTLRVELDTSNRSGKMTRNITITSNDPDEPNKTLTVSAEVLKEAN